VIATVAGVIAVIAGESLLESRPGLEQLPAVDTHEDRGILLRNVLVAFTAVVLLAAWRLGGAHGKEPDRAAQRTSGDVLNLLTTALLVVGAVAVAVLAFLAGESGAR